ncbi:kinase-like domain-containing protein [Blakeslea trispora]|nr:kinase-like domain-containing protein [Blakeslea trispora]
MGNADSVPENLNSREEVNFSHFRILKILGKGAFGKVYQVQHVKRKELYALKVINKERCIQLDAVNNMIRERTILECIDHPLICNMRFAFQDSLSLYMTMDLMSGGDLRSHLKQDHHEHVIRFWMAELVCAIKYLHSQGIVHRDIKPDNILLDQEGHVHLGDFNIACHLPNKKQRPLTSLSGTAVYFAPEMFKGSGYCEDIDWWSLGITFYECIYGIRPWLHFTNIEELSKQVQFRKIAFPFKQSVSPQCISALKAFLERDPKKRLGHGIISGWQQIASHPFFRTTDWHKMDNKQCKPIYRPVELLTSCSDHTSIASQPLVNTLLSQSPPPHEGVMGWLYRHKRQSSHVEDNSHQRLERKFKTFDYTIFDQYEGFLDQHRMTVGPPPDWVKPAYPGAEKAILPVHQIYLDQTVFDVFQPEDPHSLYHTKRYPDTTLYWTPPAVRFEQQCK